MQGVLRLLAVLKALLRVFLLLPLINTEADAASVCPQDQLINPCRCSERSNEIQIWCSYGNLNSISSALKVIAQMVPRPVDELILENNLLPSLPGHMFSTIKILRLMLRENGLQRVSANWIAGTETTLQEIYIVESELRSFPDESLITLPKLEALTLSAGLITKMPSIFGLSRLRYIQIEAAAMTDAFPNNFQGLPFAEQLHITSATKIHSLYEDFVHDLPKLSILNFTHSGLTYIHSRAFQRLPSLMEISFSGNKFSDVRLVGMAIRDLPNLVTVRLDRNNIARLEEASFVDIPSLRNLYLNNNRITHIYKASFHRLPRLRTLDLSNNLIRVIHPEAFLPMRESPVEDLWLHHNQIDHSSTIRTLLDTLPNLRLLDLSNNLLEEISFGTVHNHMHLEMLILENNRIQRIGRESFAGLPSLRELRLMNNSIGYHIGTPYWNLPALKGLDLSRNKFERLDRYLLNGLPSLRRFDISRNHLKSVEAATFMGSPFLEHVNISRNYLDVLSPLTFSQLQKLFDLDVSYNNLSESMSGIPSNIEYLYMAGNNIMVLPSSTMQEFQNSALKLLDLSHNKIYKIPATSPNSFCTLRTLLLNDNSIQVIDQSAFENLPQLRILNLANNKLIVMKKDSFKNLQHLNDLNLGKNRLEIFEPELLLQNPDLKKLDISGNRLMEIPQTAFSSNKKIEEINLSDNSFSEFPSSIVSLSLLQSLNLNRNQLKFLPNNVLQTLPLLKELYLAGNKLQLATSGVFEKLSNLSMVDLESNEIKQVGANAFHSLPKLVMIKLAKNKISSLSHFAFNDLPSLQSVELQENYLQNLANEAFTACPNLLMLNLSHNQLNAIEKAGLDGLRTLEALDLSYNQIKWLTSDSVKDMNFLVLLKLDNNRLCNIEGTPFEKMSRLRMLSLRDNKMTSLAEPTFSKLRSSILYFDIEGNPIKCSCNMLWLQSWLQQDEHHQLGPRCSDGILLRDHRMSKNNCDNVPELVPGCEVTPLTSYFTQATSLSPVVIKSHIPSTTFKPKGYLKPLPEETDYFDPKFVELFENNSKPIAYNRTNIPANILSHFIPGDTPTLYAGTRSKPNITKTNVNNQSQGSAFTFFGMPIPSLNLNNFWNSGKFLNKSKKLGRQETWPSEPEIQKDGFVPMLPGIGGFVPMNFTPENYTKQHIKEHATVAKVPLSKSTLDEVDDFLDEIEASKYNNITRRDPIVEATTTRVINQIMNIINRSDENSRTSTTEIPKLFTTNRIAISISKTNESTKTYTERNVTQPNMTMEKKPIKLPSASEFLIPEVHAPIASASSGKAVISRVQLTPGLSPHLEGSQSAQLRLAKSSFYSTTRSPEEIIKDTKNESMNWYFDNYNQSSIEPYIAGLPIIASKSYQNYPLLPLFPVGLFLRFVV